MARLICRVCETPRPEVQFPVSKRSGERLTVCEHCIRQRNADSKARNKGTSPEAGPSDVPPRSVWRWSREDIGERVVVVSRVGPHDGSLHVWLRVPGRTQSVTCSLAEFRRTAVRYESATVPA